MFVCLSLYNGDMNRTLCPIHIHIENTVADFHIADVVLEMPNAAQAIRTVDGKWVLFEI